MCIRIKRREVERRLRKERRPKCLTQCGIPALGGGFASDPKGSLGPSEGHVPEFLHVGPGRPSVYSPAFMIVRPGGDIHPQVPLALCAAGREDSGHHRAAFPLTLPGAEAHKKPVDTKMAKGI